MDIFKVKLLFSSHLRGKFIILFRQVQIKVLTKFSALKFDIYTLQEKLMFFCAIFSCFLTFVEEHTNFQ